ncbi:MAG TPA: Rho termination factor, partial [Flavobacteriaceae bacterium]|nr:Rho termination factor [Flavobacteriaceae bacterium]
MAKRIKNEDQYEALRDQGYSKEKSARIANSP